MANRCVDSQDASLMSDIIVQQKQDMAKLLTNNQRLCIVLFDENKKLYTPEREALLKIARYRIDGILEIIPQIKITDIILNGGMASYIYNEYTDIDIAVMVDIDEKIISPQNFRLILKKINKGNYAKNYNFKLLNRSVDCFLMNYLHPSSGQYSLQQDCWITSPFYRDFSFTIDEFFDAYRLYSLNVHQDIDNFEKLNSQFLSLRGCEQLEEYLFELKENALNAKIKSTEQEYCIEYQFYRCAIYFGVINHFQDFLAESYRFNLRNEIEI